MHKPFYRNITINFSDQEIEDLKVEVQTLRKKNRDMEVQLNSNKHEMIICDFSLSLSSE